MACTSDDHDRPLYDRTKPVACTIGATALPEHLALIERVRLLTNGIERTPDGVLIHFPATANVVAVVERFVAAEMQCCQFWGFRMVDEDGLQLRWEGPPETAMFMDRLVGYVEGSVPIGAPFWGATRMRTRCGALVEDLRQAPLISVGSCPARFGSQSSRSTSATRMP